MLFVEQRLVVQSLLEVGRCAQNVLVGGKDALFTSDDECDDGGVHGRCRRRIVVVAFRKGGDSGCRADGGRAAAETGRVMAADLGDAGVFAERGCAAARLAHLLAFGKALVL